MERIMCPCCRNYTIESDDEVIVDICEVCFWQYDLAAQKQPDVNIGANGLSLNEARKNYKQYGACKKEFSEKGLVKNHLKRNFQKIIFE